METPQGPLKINPREDLNGTFQTKGFKENPIFGKKKLKTPLAFSGTPTQRVPQNPLKPQRGPGPQRKKGSQIPITFGLNLNGKNKPTKNGENSQKLLGLKEWHNFQPKVEHKVQKDFKVNLLNGLPCEEPWTG